MNRLKGLEDFGQSVWLDFLSRELFKSGELTTLIERDGLKGMTSNPSIFQKSIAHGNEYDEDIKRYAEAGDDVGRIFRHLSVKDIQTATDALRPIYDATSGGDGFVSIEVSPYLAYDTQGTIEEARSLWKEIDRPNLMVKIPGTEQGIPAIAACLAEGININITLLFAQEMYERVVEAYFTGLETLGRSERLDRIASVASFFVSRIDTKTDAAIEEKLKTADPKSRPKLEDLRGKIAIANAKLAYQYYKQAFCGPRWDRLVALGARPQRLLWASTSTKNKTYPDTLYADGLIGPDTVDTIPPETMDAFRDHGTLAATLEKDVDGARQTLAAFAQAGISLDQITNELTIEGVDLFAEAADKLYASLAEKRTRILGSSLLQMTAALGEAEQAVAAEIAQWTKKGSVRRLWTKDKSLWSNADEDKWLGWLDVVARDSANLDQLREFASGVQKRKLTDVVLLGMGGSSLGSAVLSETFGKLANWPRLHVLDSTDPDQIRAIEKAITPASALFIVASKSGSTLEPNLLKDHFFHLASETSGDKAGEHFVAITDPGSALEEIAKRERFHRIFPGEPAIGGRFSVLSNFGLVPAAAMGLDVGRLLQEAKRAMASSNALSPPSTNPGIKLGIALGVLARNYGRNKITLVASIEVAMLGAWLEQLIAESTGKQGKGLIPIHAEPLGRVEAYGHDRVFVHLRLAGSRDTTGLLDELGKQGHPVIDMAMNDTYQLAQMFYLWEIAIAAAGAVIGIDPFDQPDVEAQKKKTRAMTADYEQTGRLPAQDAVASYDGISVYADARNRKTIESAESLPQTLRAHLDQVHESDYVGLLAYIEQSSEHEAALNAMRAKIRDAKRAATVVGFGPRYLHSTGQAYKGGPNQGVFITITGEHRERVTLQNRRIDFGTVQLAQALGDLDVLNERGRRAIRIHLKDIEKGLGTLGAALNEALG
jgi:transaldolase/glucose-6-phosphate isomerase